MPLPIGAMTIRGLRAAIAGVFLQPILAFQHCCCTSQLLQSAMTPKNQSQLWARLSSFHPAAGLVAHQGFWRTQIRQWEWHPCCEHTPKHLEGQDALR